MKFNFLNVTLLKIPIVLLALFIHQELLFGQKGIPLYLSEHSKVSLLTSSPGEDLYAQFGHSALRIADTLSGQDLVFNYGLFDFNTPGFYLKFVRGKLPYQLGIQRFDGFLQSYLEENRQLRELEINLSEKERLELIDFLSVNYLPENRSYAYDFFFDNCATRIRDIVENKFRATYPDTGLVKKATFRHFLAEYVGQNSWINIGFYLILGIPSDALATFRDEMFLPDYLEKHLENAVFGDKSLSSSGIRILLTNQPKAAKESWLGPLPAAWMLFFIGFIITFFSSASLAAIFDKIYFFSLFLMGALFVFMWTATDHTVTHQNMNLLWANPLYIIILLTKYSPKQNETLHLVLLLSNLLVLIGWNALPQEFHIAILPLIGINLLRLTDGWLRNPGKTGFAEQTAKLLSRIFPKRD